MSEKARNALKNDNAILAAVRRTGIGEVEMTSHGFRVNFGAASHGVSGPNNPREPQQNSSHVIGQG
jgi:hypothetical protein